MPRVFPAKKEESIVPSAPITTKHRQICMVFRSQTELYLGSVQTYMMQLLCENG